MSATYILATEDPELMRAWWALVPAGRRVVPLEELGTLSVVQRGIPMVVVLDVMALDRVPAGLRSLPTIAVGEPGSSALERVRAGGYAKVVIGYEESRTRLGLLFPLIEELAASAAALQLAVERQVSVQPQKVAPESLSMLGCCESLDTIVEHLESRDLLLEDFRRFIKRALHTSHVRFFLPAGAHFRADRGDAACAIDDALCGLWSVHPVILDGENWPEWTDPAVQVAVRQRLSQWSARLLVPIHENARLGGFVALGVRDDGLGYGEADRLRVIAISRLLRQLLQQSGRMNHLAQQNERWRLAEHYLPNVLVLSRDEPAPKHVPAPVRALIAEVRSSGAPRKLLPDADQFYRANAGLVSEGLGVWVYWEDASLEFSEKLQSQRTSRLSLLHDIALTLNHELGNALVSLAALRQQPQEALSPVILAAAKRDIATLETINKHLASIPTFGEVTPEQVDVRGLLREVAKRSGVSFEGTGPSLVLSMVPKLVEFALGSIIESLAENRPELGKRDLLFRLRVVGDGDYLTAQILVKGPKLALEGIWPAPAAGDIPSHGRISVFVAKEIIRLHGGDIRGNQTTLGSEISITLRNW